MRFIIAFLLLTSVCYAEQIQSARGIVEINDGDIYRGNSFWEGTIENLDNVTFVGTNFSRPEPHTEVFINCSNLTFVDCNLVNVELQDDFTTWGSLTIHIEEYEQGNKRYRKVEDGKNKTKMYEKIEEDIDIVERDFPDLKKKDKNKIKEKLKEQNVEVIKHIEREILISVEDTPNEKKIKGNRISPNDTRFEYLRKR